MIKNRMTKNKKTSIKLLKLWGVILVFILNLFGFSNCGPVEYGTPPVEYKDNENKSIIISSSEENIIPVIKNDETADME